MRVRTIERLSIPNEVARYLVMNKSFKKDNCWEKERFCKLQGIEVECAEHTLHFLNIFNLYSCFIKCLLVLSLVFIYWR